ncbi:hypothetical protein WA538_004079 [Blastocystis sp. DL]
MKDGLIQVTDNNFDDILDSTFDILLVFCDKTIPKCINYRPPCVSAAAMLAKLEKPIYIGEVLVEHNPMLVDKFNVTSYPQFMNVYAFGRDPDKLSLTLSDIIIAKAAMGLDHQDLIEVKTMEQWNDLRQSISILTLGVFTTKECDEYDTFDHIAYGKRNGVFFYSFLPELREQFTSDSYAFVSYHHVDDDMAILFTGDVSNYDDVSDFIDRNELPLLINYDNREACMHSITHDQLSREVFNNPRIKNQLVFFLNSQDSEYPSMRSQCLQTARELQGRTSCLYAERRHSERLMRYFGVTPVPQNAFAVHVTQEKPFERKYLYEDAMVAGKLLEFVDRALRQDSALHRLYRSEQLPDSLSYRGGCGKVVQRTFERDVLDPNVDVMVLYEKSRCDECTEPEIAMNEFSEEYEETENLKFYRAFVDMNEFSHKSTRSDHYPVVRFYPRSQNGEKKTKWINYKGAITEQGLERFLRKFATVELPEPEDDDEL